MLHPNQFEVNQTWLVFQLNGTPIPTESEGDFNCVALMDAASCFILCQTLSPSGESEPSLLAIRRLIAEAKAHKKQLPKTLLIPNGQFATLFPAEAERQGITVERVPEDQLLLFIGEAREAFEEYISGGDPQ